MRFSLIAFIFFGFSLAAYAGEAEAIRACALLKTSYYSEEQKEDIQFYCNLPEKTRNNLPVEYWHRPRDYERNFLLKQPLQPQAPRNMNNGELDDIRVSRILNNPRVCQFFSTISPSVQYGRVKEGPRLKIVEDAEDLLNKCEQFSQLIESGKMSSCSVIELAGHSTQSVGLDTIIGIDYSRGSKKIHPEPYLMNEISRCFNRILVEKGGIISSTCGGEKASDGQYRYWKQKAEAQQELSDILKIPIISGIGPVRFASQHGPNGAAAVGGWTLSYPQK